MSTPSSHAGSSTASSTSAYDYHPYLAAVKANDIRSWSAAIPSKHDGDGASVNREEAIQAYLRAKMALFQSMSSESAKKRP